MPLDARPIYHKDIPYADMLYPQEVAVVDVPEITSALLLHSGRGDGTLQADVLNLTSGQFGTTVHPTGAAVNYPPTKVTGRSIGQGRVLIYYQIGVGGGSMSHRVVIADCSSGTPVFGTDVEIYSGNLRLGGIEPTHAPGAHRVSATEFLMTFLIVEGGAPHFWTGDTYAVSFWGRRISIGGSSIAVESSPWRDLGSRVSLTSPLDMYIPINPEYVHWTHDTNELAAYVQGYDHTETSHPHEQRYFSLRFSGATLTSARSAPARPPMVGSEQANWISPPAYRAGSYRVTGQHFAGGGMVNVTYQGTLGTEPRAIQEVPDSWGAIGAVVGWQNGHGYSSPWADAGARINAQLLYRLHQEVPGQHQSHVMLANALSAPFSPQMLKDLPGGDAAWIVDQGWGSSYLGSLVTRSGFVVAYMNWGPSDYVWGGGPFTSLTVIKFSGADDLESGEHRAKGYFA